MFSDALQFVISRCQDIQDELTFQRILDSLVEEEFLSWVKRAHGLREMVDSRGFSTFYVLSACI